jgi:hypothetical protein
MSNLSDPRMSNLCGNARKTRLTRPMAYSPPKADMCGALADVRFGPKADITAHQLKDWITNRTPKLVANRNLSGPKSNMRQPGL